MTLRRADRDLAGLTVLALLWTGPRHTYDMHRMMVNWRKDFVTGLPRSMYHAVDRLLREELIAPVTAERAGSRPERTVYALTDAGHDALLERQQRLLRTPDRDTTYFVAALSFIGGMPPTAVSAALRERATVITERLAATDAQLRATADHLPRFLLLEAEYEKAMASAELTWVESVLEELESGQLTWSPQDLPGEEIDTAE